MNKRRLRITWEVLNEVKVQFQETKEFIEELLEHEFLIENGRGNYFFYKTRIKELTQKKTIFFVMLDFKAEMF